MTAQAQVERVFREEYARIVASLVRRFGDIDVAEEAAGEALLASLSLQEAGRWSLANNVQAWLLNGAEVFDAALCPPGAGTACDPTFTVSGAYATTYLAVLLALAVVASLLSFARRDVP